MSKKKTYETNTITIKSNVIDTNEEITLEFVGPIKKTYDEFGPHVIEIDLNGEYGFQYRKAAYNFVKEVRAKGKESGNLDQQFTGKLAEYVVKDLIVNSSEPEDLGHDLKLLSNIKVDVKCRGGKFPFKRIYESKDKKSDREAKHNFYARQLFDDNINYDADIYIMCHLRKPDCSKCSPSDSETKIIGTKKQKSWKLYICGWIPKASAIDAVFLPRGSMTESGNVWFYYKGNEVEFYHKHLEPLWIESNKLEPLSSLSEEAISDLIDTVKQKRITHIHITTADYARICLDLKSLGVITHVPNELITKWEPILHKNQYYHVANFLQNQNVDVNFLKLKEYLGEKITFK